jgi:Cof subfamily protein (haloacid dehalogenase superfamily)
MHGRENEEVDWSQMRYCLIATDIDGTLLNERHEVTPRTRAAVRELQRRNIPLVLTTARPARAVQALYRQLELSGPFIAYNGALVYDPDAAETLFHHPIPLAIARRLLDCVRAVSPSLTVGLEMPDGWYLDRIDPHLQARIDAGLVEMMPTVCEVEKVLSETAHGVNKLYFVASDAVRAAMEAHFVSQGLHTHVAVTSSSAEWVEISAVGVDKGAAMEALAARLGIPMENTLALGDGENDIPALQRAGLGIAMGHAPEQVRRAADVVTTSNTEDGWAAAIERYVFAQSTTI